MDIKRLKDFLVETNKHGYGVGDTKSWIKEKDHSTTIQFQSGNFRMHDNFFGGEPWGGREIIFYKDEPVWIMVMYGKVDSSVEDFEEVYEFLQRALLKQPEEIPLRGPKMFKEEKFVYKNKIKGNLENFFGEEIIYSKNKPVYIGNFFGGLVDVRKED